MSSSIRPLRTRSQAHVIRDFEPADERPRALGEQTGFRRADGQGDRRFNCRAGRDARRCRSAGPWKSSSGFSRTGWVPAPAEPSGRRDQDSSVRRDHRLHVDHAMKWPQADVADSRNTTSSTLPAGPARRSWRRYREAEKTERVAPRRTVRPGGVPGLLLPGP